MRRSYAYTRGDMFSLLCFPATRRVPEGAIQSLLSQGLCVQREEYMYRMRSRVSGRLDRMRNTKGANYNDNAAFLS